uniref:Uncharacterized protein n=1 Tax=Arundo donax TaxID=35708 RepID=A0A0A8ZGI6_ARUDO
MLFGCSGASEVVGAGRSTRRPELQ